MLFVIIILFIPLLFKVGQGITVPLQSVIGSLLLAEERCQIRCGDSGTLRAVQKICFAQSPVRHIRAALHLCCQRVGGGPAVCGDISCIVGLQ